MTRQVARKPAARLRTCLSPAAKERNGRRTRFALCARVARHDTARGP
jgi:hypothetical protein